MRTDNRKLAEMTDDKCPHFPMVALDLLRRFGLNNRVSICISQIASLSPCVRPSTLSTDPTAQHVVIIALPNLHDALLVGIDRLVAIPEIESPSLDVLVHRANDDKFRV
jgi:hypothetical protein